MKQPVVHIRVAQDRDILLFRSLCEVTRKKQGELFSQLLATYVKDSPELEAKANQLVQIEQQRQELLAA